MQFNIRFYKHYISAKVAGEKWNISQPRVFTLCTENNIKGWYNARNNLNEIFEVMEHISNINVLESFLLENI